MTYKNHVIVAALAAIGFSGPLAAKPLADELQSLLVEHPLIKSARKMVESADQGRDAARSGYLPKLSITGDTGQENISSRSYLAGADGRIISSTPSAATPQKSDLIRNKFSTVIEQNIFAGGRTAALVGIADIEFAAQENAFRSTVQSVLLEAISTYLQVTRYQTLIAIAKRNENTTQRQLSLEDERVQRGGGVAVDVLQAKTRLQIAKERRVFNEQGLRDAIANYRQVFGHEPDLSRIQDLDTLTERLPKTLDAAIEQAYADNPNVREALLQVRKLQKQIGVESAGMYPIVDLVGSQSHDRNANQLAARDESSVVLRFNWNLFSGLETRSRTGAATSAHGAMVDREVSVLRKTEESVRIAWHQLENGRERQDLLENAANISFEVMRNRKRLRDAGKETAINVLDSEVEYFGVLASKINASYDTRLGGYRLLTATGKLSPELLGLTDGTFAVPVKPLNLVFDDPDEKVAAAATTPVVAAPVAASAAPSPEQTMSAVMADASDPASAKSAVLAVLDAWLAAWSARDVEAYLASYSADFVPRRGMPRAEWEQQRTQRIGQAEWITLTMSELNIAPRKNGNLRATFTQAYSSNRISETGPKTLDFALEKDGWKIVAER